MKYFVIFVWIVNYIYCADEIDWIKNYLIFKLSAMFKNSERVYIPNFDTYQLYSNGKVVNSKRNSEIKPITNRAGYVMVRLNKNGKRVALLLHRLLAISFIPNPFNKPFINHKDGNKANFSLSNLEWCTQKENIEHYRSQLKNKPYITQICDYAFPISSTMANGTIDKRHHLSNMIKKYVELMKAV